MLGISLFLLLKVFLLGCFVLIGVEVILNVVFNFKELGVKNVVYILMLMGGILVVLFSGIMFLVYWFGIFLKVDEMVVL